MKRNKPAIGSMDKRQKVVPNTSIQEPSFICDSQFWTVLLSSESFSCFEFLGFGLSNRHCLSISHDKVLWQQLFAKSSVFEKYRFCSNRIPPWKFLRLLCEPTIYCVNEFILPETQIIIAIQTELLFPGTVVTRVESTTEAEFKNGLTYTIRYGYLHSSILGLDNTCRRSYICDVPPRMLRSALRKALRECFTNGRRDGMLDAMFINKQSFEYAGVHFDYVVVSYANELECCFCKTQSAVMLQLRPLAAKPTMLFCSNKCMLRGLVNF